MKDLKKFHVMELKQNEQLKTSGGAMSVNQERFISWFFFGLVGLAVYELSRNQSK
jgi:hypothetical protein